MTIYMVIADNCNTQWNEAAFASRELAEEYVFNRINKRSEDYKRMYEIEKIENSRKLTDNEIAEYWKLNHEWNYDWVRYHIEPFDVRE